MPVLKAGLLPVAVRELMVKDRRMWKESVQISMPHVLARTGIFAEQVQELENNGEPNTQKENRCGAENCQNQYDVPKRTEK